MAFRLTLFKNFVKPSTPSLYFAQTRGIVNISGRGKEPDTQSPEQKTGTVAAKAEERKSEQEAQEDLNTMIGKGPAKGQPKDKGNVPQYGQGQNKGQKI